MDYTELLKQKKQEILKAADKFGASNIRIFGSVALGIADEKSDIDFLVDFKDGVGLLEWSGFWLELENILGCKVDVATEKVLKERIRDKVLKQAKPI